MPATEPITDQSVIEDTLDTTDLVDDESHLIRGYD